MREDKPDSRPDPTGKYREPDKDQGKEPNKDKGHTERISKILAERVRAFAFDGLAPGRRGTTNLYLDHDPLPAGSTIGPKPESYTVDRHSWLVFADHHPRTAFGHNCSYYLHDARTGELYRRIAAQFPPYPHRDIHQLQRFHEPVPPIRSLPLPRRPWPGFEVPMQVSSGGAPAGKRYAILFAGQCDRFHANDLELSYRALLDVFGFDPANVIVLLHNGTKTGTPFLDDDGVTLRQWPGKWPDNNKGFRMQLTGSGTREAFNTALTNLHLTANDLLFIHTAGHGDSTFRGQCMRLRPDGSDLYFSDQMQNDLVTQLGGTCRSLLVFMNQCYSGGFSTAIKAVGTAKSTQTFFAAACAADDWAHATDDENWSEFALNWYEAEMQHHIDPAPYMPGTDDDGDGKVEASEAYDYCVFMNSVSKGFDSPVLTRVPDPDLSGNSSADEIVLA